MPIKKYFIHNFSINLHFSFQNPGYIAVYKYIYEDYSTDNILISPGHVKFNAIGSTCTKKYMKANAKC